MFENKITSEALTDVSGIRGEVILSEKELNSNKIIKVILETSEDGKVWWEDQSLVWEGPYEEYPIIEPSSIKGRLYRVVIEYPDTIEVNISTKAK